MGGQGLLLLMELKVLIMMTRPQNITVATLLAGNSNVLRPGHHYQKFKFHQQQEVLAAHFDFTSFSAQRFLDSWPQLFLHQGCFGWDNYSTGKTVSTWLLLDISPCSYQLLKYIDLLGRNLLSVLVLTSQFQL